MAYEAMLFCDYHARQRLDAEFRRRKRKKRRRFDAEERWIPSLGDTIIVDENGHDVWAEELAYRYRRELTRRMKGDFRVS